MTNYNLNNYNKNKNDLLKKSTLWYKVNSSSCDNVNMLFATLPLIYIQY